MSILGKRKREFDLLGALPNKLHEKVMDTLLGSRAYWKKQYDAVLREMTTGGMWLRGPLRAVRGEAGSFFAWDNNGSPEIEDNKVRGKELVELLFEYKELPLKMEQPYLKEMSKEDAQTIYENLDSWMRDYDSFELADNPDLRAQAPRLWLDLVDNILEEYW